MTALVNILALLAAAVVFAYIFKEKLTEILPLTVCLLSLLLYLLGLLGHLSWIDWISVGVLAVTVIWWRRKEPDTRAGLRNEILESMKEPGFIVLMVTISAVVLLTGNKMISWWDDFNFWATDAKALFYLDGFAGKYQNVAPEFGDYPPGTQMMKWWFLHFFPGEFREGQLFGGYYTLNLVLMAPLLRYLKGKNILILILCGAAMWSFPYAAESFYLEGTCADLTLALAYGAFLTGVLDRDGHRPVFYYGRMALYLMVLLLTKNTAFIWAAFGLVFALIFTLIHKMPVRRWLLVAALGGAAEGSWLLFCLLNRRVARLTGTAVRMAAGGVELPDYTGELWQSFREAFLYYPLHRYRTLAVDLTPLGICLLLLIFFGILVGRKIVTRRDGLWIGGFMLGSGLLYYGILMLSHLTLFAQETQYLHPEGMIASIERYGAPFTIGSLYVIAALVLREQKSTYGGYWACLLTVMAMADPGMLWRGLVQTEEVRAGLLSSRSDIMDENADLLLETIRGSGMTQARILYLKDGADISWVQHAYLSFDAAPVSVVSGYVQDDIWTPELIAQAVREAHANYLYVNPSGPNVNDILTDMSGDEVFVYRQLYRIEGAEKSIRLTAAEGRE